MYYTSYHHMPMYFIFPCTLYPSSFLFLYISCFSFSLIFYLSHFYSSSPSPAFFFFFFSSTSPPPLSHLPISLYFIVSINCLPKKKFFGVHDFYFSTLASLILFSK
uniref:Uncharacterized protein n=1 Tax=Cacopsylla melanoneura TaxID=428564 RepID=A0A8D8V709_9HEMI